MTPPPSERLRLPSWLAPLAITVAVVVVYLPSLSGGFLNWDDDWLIADNPILTSTSAQSLVAIWTDFSQETRLALGAEYLPVRDTSMWLALSAFGANAFALRCLNLLLYVASVLCFWLALRRSFNGKHANLAADATTLLFALHPIHVESVAWLASHKDVLALVFFMAALAVYSGRDQHTTRLRIWWVPALLLLSHLSKSMTVIAAGLLLAQDVLARRKPHWPVLGAAGAVACSAFAIHFQTGSAVQMLAEPLGGSRTNAIISMGPVWLRYLTIMLWPPNLSIVQLVEPLQAWTVASVAGYGLLAVSLATALLLWRQRGRPLALSAWLWSVVPLLPVSQVLFPLQNAMADRYALLSVAGLCILVGDRLVMWGRVGLGAALALGLTLGSFTAQRAYLFSDSALVFQDAAEKSPDSALAHYQLAKALDAHGRVLDAIQAYEACLRSPQRSHDARRRASNNLARLYVQQGELAGAERILRSARAQWPDDPKLWGNLVKVLARQGRTREAERLFRQLARQFPDYAGRPRARSASD